MAFYPRALPSGATLPNGGAALASGSLLPVINGSLPLAPQQGHITKWWRHSTKRWRRLCQMTRVPIEGVGGVRGAGSRKKQFAP